MVNYYVLIKAVHIVFMVTWFAGLFYLPRLFIYHVQTADKPGRDRFSVMEKRLFAIMTIGAALTWAFGLALVAVNTAIATTVWFQAKVVLVIGLMIYHYRCWLWIKRLSNSSAVQDSGWLRWFNEIPVLFLFAIVILAVAKPF